MIENLDLTSTAIIYAAIGIISGWLTLVYCKIHNHNEEDTFVDCTLITIFWPVLISLLFLSYSAEKVAKFYVEKKK